jgi:hypothetical protein
MHPDPEVQKAIDTIRDYVSRMERTDFDSSVLLMKEMYDALKSQFAGQPGMQSLVLSTASGDIRHLRSPDSGILFDTWIRWMNEDGMQPEQLPEETIRQASKRVFGRGDAFVYIR